MSTQDTKMEAVNVGRQLRHTNQHKQGRSHLTPGQTSHPATINARQEAMPLCYYRRGGGEYDIGEGNEGLQL